MYNLYAYRAIEIQPIRTSKENTANQNRHRNAANQNTRKLLHIPRYYIQPSHRAPRACCIDGVVSMGKASVYTKKTQVMWEISWHTTRKHSITSV